eukprot:1150675-Pelagomonas_calceolata.AAC.4
MVCLELAGVGWLAKGRILHTGMWPDIKSVIENLCPGAGSLDIVTLGDLGKARLPVMTFVPQAASSDPAQAMPYACRAQGHLWVCTTRTDPMKQAMHLKHLSLHPGMGCKSCSLPHQLTFVASPLNSQCTAHSHSVQGMKGKEILELKKCVDPDAN